MDSATRHLDYLNDYMTEAERLRSRGQLSAEKLGLLVNRLAQAKGARAKKALREKIMRGWYGHRVDAGICRACKRYVIDIERTAEVETKRLVRLLPLLLRCPNYIWDAAVEVIGDGNKTSAVEWLIHRDVNLHATLTPIEIAVRDDPDLVMQRLGGIEYGVFS